MVMAAGLGTRLRPFTDEVPKPLLPVFGVPMAQFAIDSLTDFGVTKIVANIHHHAKACASGLKRLDLGGAELLISDEGDRLLGSGGGLRRASTLLGNQAYFLINPDVFCAASLSGLAQRHALLRRRWGVTMTLCISTGKPGGEKYREIHFDPETGLIRGLGEFVSGKPHFASVAVLEPEATASLAFDEAAEFVPEVLLPAIRSGKAGVYFGSGPWYDIGNPGLWLNTHCEIMEMIEKGGAPKLWSKRIESENRRITDHVWVGKSSPRRIRTVDWIGPCYWNPLSESTDRPPRFLGPRSVLYGEAALASEFSLRNGIGYRGKWVSAESHQPCSINN